MKSESRFLNRILAIERITREASFADGPEEALWTITRALPSLMAETNAAVRPDPRGSGTAAAAFMLTPDERFHLTTAPVNFGPGQRHEKVALALGHPGHVARTRHALLLHDTAHHESFVRILQTFRAKSAMFAPLLWDEDYLGVLICASSVPGTFSEADLSVHKAFASVASALWIAKDGPNWLTTLDYDALPERHREAGSEGDQAGK